MAQHQNRKNICDDIPNLSEINIASKIQTQLTEQLGLSFKPAIWDFIFKLNGMGRLLNIIEKQCLGESNATDFLCRLFKSLNISYTVNNAPKIPQSGGVMMVSNHPMGIPETLFLLDYILRLRPDVKVLATSLVPPFPQFKDIIIPINVYENSREARKKVIHQIQQVKDHLGNGGALLMFPAGMMSISEKGQIMDPLWNITFSKLSQETGVPVAPFHVGDQNPKWFYHLDKIHPILRTFLMPRMLINKKNKNFRIQGRPLIEANDVVSFKSASDLRDHCYKICCFQN